MISVREATADDAPAIRDIFQATYGEAYPYKDLYDLTQLIRMVFSEDTVLLVAEDTATGQILGTASVILQVGAYSDLAGEFGRLAVHPDARGRGVGRLLLSERLRRVQDRLHVGLIEARVTHPYTLRIAEAHQFAVVGFYPMKMLLQWRESLTPLARYFGSSLDLRNNHPRIIPEAHSLAHQSMENCGLAFDGIVDEQAPSYPHGEDLEVQELTTEGYSGLLRIERGRVRHREIFGPLRLHYGLFMLHSRSSRYLLAREGGRIVGAVGFMVDPLEKTARIFELIALHDHVIRFLLTRLELECREGLGVCYLETDVSAYAPRMQRTLLELGFLPVAYIPAMVFHEVERLDVLRMARLLCPLELGPLALSPKAREMADIVLRGFRSRTILPRIARAVQEVPLFAGLSGEQVSRLAGACTLEELAPGEIVFRQDQGDSRMFVVLAGEVSILADGGAGVVGQVRAGECLGEMAMLTHGSHSATAQAATPLELAALTHADLEELIRARPDIGLIIYRNLAIGLGAKLKRSSQTPKQ